MLSFKAAVGVEAYLDGADNLSNQPWHYESIYEGALTYKNALDTASLDAAKMLEPYINGTETFLNTITLSDAHIFNSLFTGNSSVSYQFSSNTDNSADSLKSLFNATAGIVYHATENLDITSSYQFRDQTLTNVPGSQIDNQFLIGLVYRPLVSGKI